MLRLVCKNRYIIFRIITSGSDAFGIQVTQGNQNKAKQPDHYWFTPQQRAGLISRAASLIRAKLDKHYYREQTQFDLFGSLETQDSLFEEKQENNTEHPLLNKAYELAHQLPSTVKWTKTLLAAPMPCNLCGQTQPARTITYIALVKSPVGAVLHLQCQDCRIAEKQPAQFKPKPTNVA